MRPTATSLDTYRDIIYLEPVICWDVSQPGQAANQRTGSGHVTSRLESCLHLFGQFSASRGLLPRLPCNYGGFRVFSGQAGATHLIHPPITPGRDKTLKCFWTVCNIYLSARLYILSRDLDWELFYTMTNQNLIEMILRRLH